VTGFHLRKILINASNQARYYDRKISLAHLAGMFNVLGREGQDLCGLWGKEEGEQISKLLALPLEIKRLGRTRNISMGSRFLRGKR